MNKEKLIANWDNLKIETKAQILELAKKEIEKGWFLPKMGEEYFVPKEEETYYYYEYSSFNAKTDTLEKYFCNSYFDTFNIETGNCFRTEEEAEFAGNCDYFTKLFETYVNRHSKKLEWGNGDQREYYVFYNLDDMDIEYDYIYSYKQQGTTYASSEQILRDAIADIGEDNFLKYVMKVEK